MRSSFAVGCAFLFICLGDGGAAIAVDAPEERTPTQDTTGDATEVVRAVRRAYREGPIAERIRVVAKSSTGDGATSTILARYDRGDIAAGRPQRLRLELGPIIAVIEKDRLVVMSALNTEDYYEARLDARPLDQQLADVFPPVPLPQIAWVFAGDAAPERGPSGSVEESLGTLGIVAWKSAVVSGPAARLAGTMHMQDADAQFVGLGSADLGLKSFTAPTRNGLVLTLACERVAPGEPTAWMPDLAGRRRVDTIAMLRPKAGDVPVGTRIPALGLMSSDLNGWPLSDNLRAMEGDPPRKVGAALVLYHAGKEGVLTPVKAGLLAAASIAREYVIAELSGAPSSPRMLVRAVGLLELGEVSPQRAEQLTSDWQALLGPAEPQNVGDSSWREPLWSSTGKETLERVLPGASAAILVVDQQQKLLAVVALEGRNLDQTTIAAEVKAAFEGAGK